MKLFEKKKPVSAAAASGEEKKDDAAVPVSVQLRRKAVIMGISLVLLLVLAAAGTVGWYTRMNNVSGITLDIAKFDFRANYSDNTFMVDVNDYREVEHKKAAPGTSGVIPVLLTNNSEVAADYYLYMDLTGMAPEMLQRVRFYVYRAQTNANGNYIKDKDGKVLPVYEADGKTPKKFYLGGIRTLYAKDSYNNGGSSTLKDTVVSSDYLQSGNGIAYDLASCGGLDSVYFGNYLNYFVVTGTLYDAKSTNSSNSCYEYVYWEWIYDLDPAAGCVFYNLQDGHWESWTKRGYGLSQTDLTKLVDAHDAFDTDLGNGVYDKVFDSKIDTKNFHFDFTKTTSTLLAYQAALMPKIAADGVQATPLGKVADGQHYAQDILKAGGGLTVYVDEDAVYGRK